MKILKELLLLVLIGQITPELSAQNLNSITENESEIEEKVVSSPQTVTSVASERITKHGVELVVSKINPEEALDDKKVLSPDELDDMEEQNKEYFKQRYLNKQIVVIGAFDSISRRDKNYKLKIDRFKSGVFSTSLSCSFADMHNLKTLMQALDVDNYYVLVKGTVTSSSHLDNCTIVGVAKFAD